MKKNRDLDLLVLNEEQVNCLASPLRKELMATFISFGPASVSEVAARLNRRSKSLYYHVEQMEAQGLLKIVGRRASVKKPEAVYDAVAPRIEFAKEQSESYRAATRKSIQALLRLVSRQMDAAEEAGLKPRVTKLSLRLSGEDQKEWNRRVQDLLQWAEMRDDPGRPIKHVLLLEIPLTDGSRPSGVD